MSDPTFKTTADLPEIGPCEAAWNEYQESLGNLTEIEEARIRRAFLSGWILRSKRSATSHD